MKKILISLLILLIIPCVLAVNLKIEKQSSDEVLITELKQPAIFDLEIKNLGSSDNFLFYNMAGFKMTPVGTVYIASGETKNVQVTFYPIDENFDIKSPYYAISYYIEGGDSSNTKQELTMKVVKLQNAFGVSAVKINPDSEKVRIYIKNKENFDFGEIKAKFSSAFFELDEEFSLSSYENKSFEIRLNKEETKKLTAGFYTIITNLEIGKTKVHTEGILEFEEKSSVITSKKSSGIFIRNNIISRTNEGNVVANSDAIVKKNIISRLFTSFNPKPDTSERKGLSIEYYWNYDLKPGEKLDIVVRTNWFIPLLIIVLIAVITILSKRISRTDLILKKRISFVKAKGGEFALKVIIIINAKKRVEKVRIIDRLPPLVKLYERFGLETPTRINEKNKTLEWHFEKLEEGETRMLSYLVYSKVGVLGKFALPITTAFYEKNGQFHEATSNRTFFVAEPRGKKEIEG